MNNNLRRVRGAKELVKYLESIGCPMSESTIYKLLRENAYRQFDHRTASFYLI